MLAVTTRNRLRSARFCLPMLRARALIARQLAQAPGLVRYASGVVSPTEFLTLTVWEDRAAMRAFMQSGAHAQLLWEFTRWTASFWGMRWEPGGEEHGAWNGARLARTAARPQPLSPLARVGLLPARRPLAGPTGPRPASGAVEPRESGLFAALAVCAGPRALLAGRALGRRLAERPASAAGPVRWSVGLDLPCQALVVSLWRDEPGAREQALRLLAEGLGATWAMCWEPGDYEIGHWDGLRLRQAARRGRLP